MKRFNEFVQDKMANAAATGQQMQQPVNQNVFSNVGMDQASLSRFMRSTRQMLSSRGVVQGGDDKKAARRVLAVLRQPIMRLVNMGLGADDIMLVVQEVINLVVGMRSYTGLNANMVRSRISNQLSQQQ